MTALISRPEVEVTQKPWVTTDLDTLWFVLHTRSRTEKKVAELLKAKAVAHYMPLVDHIRFYGSHKAKVSVPLFPSYVFLKGNREDAYSLDRGKHLVNILDVPDQEQMEWELENIWKALSADADLQPHDRVKCGTRVEVRSGPFRGLQGVVESRSRFARLILKVSMLGRAMSLEVDGSLLDPID